MGKNFKGAVANNYSVVHVLINKYPSRWNCAAERNTVTFSLPKLKPMHDVFLTTTNRHFFRCFHRHQHTVSSSLARSLPSIPILGLLVCAVCADGYTTGGVRYTCEKCTGGRQDATIAVISVVLLLAVLLAVAASIKYLRSESKQTSGGGSAVRRGVAWVGARLKRLAGAQTLKIIIVSWQIITQVIKYALLSLAGKHVFLYDDACTRNTDWCMVHNKRSRLLSSNRTLEGRFAVAMRSGCFYGRISATLLPWINFRMPNVYTRP